MLMEHLVPLLRSEVVRPTNRASNVVQRKVKEDKKKR
jgi:hypothetical protein